MHTASTELQGLGAGYGDTGLRAVSGKREEPSGRGWKPAVLTPKPRPLPYNMCDLRVGTEFKDPWGKPTPTPTPPLHTFCCSQEGWAWE